MEMYMKRKGLWIAVLTVITSLTLAFPVFAGQWQSNETGWWYQYSFGDIRTSEGIYTTGEFGLGYPVSKWEVIENKIYYFDEVGYMAHDKIIDSFQVGSDGARINNYEDLEVVPYIDELEEVIQNNDELYYYGEGFGLDLKDELNWENWQLTDCGDYFEIADVQLIQTYVEGSSLPPAVFGEISTFRIRKDALCLYGTAEDLDGGYNWVETSYPVAEWIENFGLPRIEVRFDDKGYIISFSDAAVS